MAFNGVDVGKRINLGLFTCNLPAGSILGFWNGAVQVLSATGNRNGFSRLPRLLQQLDESLHDASAFHNSSDAVHMQI